MSYKIKLRKGPKPLPLKERFLRHVKVCGEQECWPWLGHTSDKGYGKFLMGRQAVLAHTVSYQLFVGPIPEGKEVDHLCHNRICQNPSHLEAVTHTVNIQRGDRSKYGGPVNRAKTHCPKGHPYDEGNTHITVDGRRKCRTCDRERHRKKGGFGCLIR